jgi:hypothetical protein
MYDAPANLKEFFTFGCWPSGNKNPYFELHESNMTKQKEVQLKRNHRRHSKSQKITCPIRADGYNLRLDSDAPKAARQAHVLPSAPRRGESRR